LGTGSLGSGFNSILTDESTSFCFLPFLFRFFLEELSESDEDEEDEEEGEDEEELESDEDEMDLFRFFLEPFSDLSRGFFFLCLSVPSTGLSERLSFSFCLSEVS